MGMRMSVSDLGDEWQQHAKHNQDDVGLRHRCLSERCIQVSVDNRLVLRVCCLGHRMHGDVPVKVSRCNNKKHGLNTYKNVPPEKHSTQPVDHVSPSSPPSVLRPNI